MVNNRESVQATMAGVPTVALMVKAPRPGFVKTRLARAIGDQRARAVYRWLAERQLSALPAGWPVTIHFDPADAEDEMRSWLGADKRYRPQVNGNLGARMADAVETAISQGAPAVILLGVDCPEVVAADLETAWRRLVKGADAVFGPTKDGGYYLLGLRAVHRGMFEGVPWSSPRTLEASLAKAGELSLKIALLPEMEDIDDRSSLEREIAQGTLPAGLAVVSFCAAEKTRRRSRPAG